jgi:hypothetical protein
MPGSPNFYDNVMMGITVYFKKLKKWKKNIYIL